MFVQDVLSIEDGKVVLDLVDTYDVNRWMDNHRRKIGYKPLFFGKDEECDLEGWYTYNAVVTMNEIHVYGCVCNVADNDDEHDYEIPLSEFGGEIPVYNRLDKCCSENFGKSLYRMLIEAQK